MTDLISRQAVLEKAVYTETEEGWSGYSVDVKDIEALPSVHAEPRTGHWIGGELGHCSVCGAEGCASDIWNGCDSGRYCPNCGAKMEEQGCQKR